MVDNIAIQMCEIIILPYGQQSDHAALEAAYSFKIIKSEDKNKVLPSPTSVDLCRKTRTLWRTL